MTAHKSLGWGSPNRVWDIVVRKIVFQRGKHLTSCYEEGFRQCYRRSTSTRPAVFELEQRRVNPQDGYGESSCSFRDSLLPRAPTTSLGTVAAKRNQSSSLRTDRVP